MNRESSLLNIAGKTCETLLDVFVYGLGDVIETGDERDGYTEDRERPHYVDKCEPACQFVLNTFVGLEIQDFLQDTPELVFG
jgi:hypothetical protein